MSGNSYRLLKLDNRGAILALLHERFSQLKMANSEVRIERKSFPALLHGFFEEVQRAQCVCHIRADYQRKRIQTLRLLQFEHTLRIFPQDQQVPGVPMMRN